MIFSPPGEEEKLPELSPPKSGMSGASGSWKVTPTKSKEALHSTPRGHYTKATPVEGQHPVSIDSHIHRNDRLQKTAVQASSPGHTVQCQGLLWTEADDSIVTQ